MSDSLRTLSALHPDLRVYAPGLGADIGPLLSEAKIALNHATGRERNGLDQDLANLAEGVSALVDLLKAGVSTEDMDEALGNLRVLALNLRQDCTRIISERGRELRLNAEVAVARKDRSRETVDVTDAFRAVFAQPAVSRGGFVSEALLPLPEAGGAIGRVEGPVMLLRLTTPERRRSAESPEETESRDEAHETFYRNRRATAPAGSVFLPEGAEVVMKRGESFVIHNAGHAIKGSLTIEGYVPGDNDLIVEAKEDGVKIFGPATLSPNAGKSLAEMSFMIEHLKDEVKKMPFFQKPKFWQALAILCAPFAPICLIAVFKGASLFLGFPALVMFSFLIKGEILEKNKSLREIGLGLFREKFFVKISKDDFAAVKTISKYLKQNIHETEKVQFFPSRKVLCQDKAGPRILRPTLMLSAPNEIPMTTVFEKAKSA